MASQTSGIPDVIRWSLAPLFQVVVLDLRVYNLSDKPLGGEHYLMHHLVEDVQAVIRD
jgi:hypothetical protein